MTLQELLGFTFEYPTIVSDDDRNKVHYLPDVQLMVLIVISTKLLFPFDDLKRYPTTANEPATQIMNWPLWERAQHHFEGDPRVGDKIEKGTAIQVTDQDVLTMTPAQLDGYMDWYESSWLDTSRAPSRIAEMFPISRAEPDTQPSSTIASALSSASAPAPPSSASASVPTLAPPGLTQEKLDLLLKTVMQDLRARRVIPDDEEAEDRRPGEWYHRYRWESQLTGPARTFYEAAAKLAAVPLKTFVRAVTLAEFRIAKQDEERQNREFFATRGKEGIDSDESDVDNTYGMDGLEEDMSEPEFEDMDDDDMISNSKMWSTI